MSESWSIATLPDKVNYIDVNHMTYGNFIGVIYLFDEYIDSKLLKMAWNLLQEQLPALSGVYDPRAQSIVKSAPAPFLSAESDHRLAEFQKLARTQSVRSQFIHEHGRKKVLTGQSALASLTHTRLANKGSVIGLAVNHLITDAGGFHKIARHLADIYNALANNKTLPPGAFITRLTAFEFGSERDWPMTRAELKRQGLKAPVSLRGLTGVIPYKLIIWSMGKITSQQRLHIHLSPDQVQRLKKVTLEETGEDWISTNAALCGHFTAIMTDLIHDGKPKKPIRMGQLLDLRGRYFEDTENLQNQFIGNAILIHTEAARLDIYDRGNLARFFKSMVTKLSAEFIRDRLDVISDCLRHGRTYPGLEMGTPLMAVNNQTKMPVYDLDFDGHKTVDIIPQDVGDNIVFFPANDGGVDVYIRDILNPKRQQKLEDPEWQARIFDF